MLATRVPLIVEANFFTGQAQRFATLPDHRLVQVHCSAPLAVLLERYAARDRHPGHRDAEKITELPARYASGAHDALDLAGEVVRVDTFTPVDVAAITERVRALL
jgi:hypothetical protein